MSVDAVLRRDNLNGGDLDDFHDTAVLRIELAEGLWVVIGRVFLWNFSGTKQYVTARLRQKSTGADVDYKRNYQAEQQICYSLQAVLEVKDRLDTVSIQCDTYKGRWESPSIVAIRVDSIDWGGPGR
ncbi:hypothetical protein [Paraburkholderia terrae]|uniref:Uncharacterized protein n=1 Tax=Paraburkholderia terrae TaxID=311230 RepID=A0A2I8F3P1_9BURK|nr:hypothetical protein [Paraburkholderia terrae]AUT66282.1 hypothetical protein C2L65_41800 [Paraburkholderia terrae]